jgi:hypothetical protein
MKADQKVTLRDSNGNETVSGTIVGLGHLVELGASKPFYMVKLDQSFSDPAQKLTITVVTVDRKTLVPI